MAKKEQMIQFTSGMSRGLSTYSDNVQLVNYFNISTPTERSQAQLVDVAGSTTWQTLEPDSGIGCRNLWVASTGPSSNGYTATLYGVFGNTLYRIDKSGTKTKIGVISSKTSIVTFAENQDQTLTETFGFVCDGLTVYQWDLKAENSAVAESFKEIESLPDVIGDVRAVAKYISYNTYRLILTTDNSLQWYYTGLNNTTWSGFESSESNPDKTIRAVSFGGNIWVFSNYSYDIFSYTGANTDPYDVASGATGKIGCVNGDTIATHGDFMFWVGQGDTSNDSVFMATVTGGIKEITTPGMQNILRSWKYINYSKGFAFTDRGQTFYVLTSKQDDQTYVFCVETNTWHQRSSSIDGKLHYWDVTNVIGVYGKTYFGTNDSNEICEFNYTSIVDHNNNPITRYWQSPVYINGLDMFKIIELKIDVECGTSTTLGYSPTLFIQLSWDGGKTWGERMIRSLGTTGQYATQVALYGGGAGRNLVMRIGTSATIPVTLYQIKFVVEGAGRT